MVVVFVDHYLNEQGIQYFPDWIRSTRGKVAQFQGFVSLSQLDEFNQNSCVLELKFQFIEQLKDWSTSQEHTNALEQLLPYRLKKHTSRLFKYT